MNAETQAGTGAEYLIPQPVALDVYFTDTILYLLSL
jgi:hypothetical protein